MLESIRSIGRTRVLAVAGTVVLVALVVPFLVFAVPQVVGGSHSYVVLSGSMEPAISPGDVVIVGDVRPESLQVDDVITFNRGTNDVPTTHRIVEVLQREDGLAFRTMGDANEDPDGAPVPAENVVGEVFLVIPYIGYVIRAANTQTGFLALVVAPFALLALTEAYSYVRNRGDEDTGGSDGGGRPTDGSYEEPGVPTADGTTATTTAAETTGSDAADAGSMAVSDETLVAVRAVLGVATVYALAVAYVVRTPWAIGAAVAGLGALAFVTYIRYSEPDPVPAATHADGGVGDVVTGATPDEFDHPVVTVESFDELSALGADRDRPLVYDPERSRYVLIDDATVYVHEEPAVDRPELDDSEVDR